MTDTHTPVVGIYQRNFLSVSMTFIYRQLMGVRDEFLPIVLATTLNNQQLFPYPHVYLRGVGAIERACSKVLREVTGGVPSMSHSRRRFWHKILIDHDVKLVHAHFGPSGIEVLPVAKSLKLPLIVTFHGYDASSALKDPKYVSKLQELFEYAHIVTVSNSMANELIAIGANPARTRVHYIGAPIDDFKFIRRKALQDKVEDGDTIEFLQVSNFVEKKGQRYSLEAFRNFSLHYPRCKLLFAGQGPLRASVERLCDELNIKDKVHFVGPVSKHQVIRLMTEADIFLHHSVTAENGDREGIPTVLMEAMATGLVVVSTYHSGIPELVTDGENGFLVHERDVSSYTDKLISSPSHAAGMPTRAASTIEKYFNQARQNGLLKEIYSEVLAKSA